MKREGLNPSGAFKDRPAALVAALAQDSSADGVITASSGNASAAIAAYCAAARLGCTVLLEPGNPPAKLRQTILSGARVIPVDGIFRRGPEAVSELILAVAAKARLYPAFVWAPVNPYILEGIKTISYEVVAQLGAAPDVVISPVGGGDMLAAQWRGYLELRRARVIQSLPRMIAVQSSSAPPLYRSFQAGATSVATLPEASSRISGINVPFSGDHALRAVYESGGLVAVLDDDQILAMQSRMATEEGVWVEPVGAAAMAALEQLRDQGDVDPGDSIVCILSGAGFKDGELGGGAAEAISQSSVAPFDADAIVGRFH
jgi:threonine synthase